MPSSLRQISLEKEAGMIHLSVLLCSPLILLFISCLKSYWQLLVLLARALWQQAVVPSWVPLSRGVYAFVIRMDQLFWYLPCRKSQSQRQAPPINVDGYKLVLLWNLCNSPGEDPTCILYSQTNVFSVYPIFSPNCQNLVDHVSYHFVLKPHVLQAVSFQPPRGTPKSNLNVANLPVCLLYI